MRLNTPVCTTGPRNAHPYPREPYDGRSGDVVGAPLTGTTPMLSWSMSVPNVNVFVVDDDPDVRAATARLLQGAGLRVRCYADGPSFLEACPDDATGCLLLDVDLPGMSGQQVHAALRHRGIRLPVIFLTGVGDVPMAVAAVRAGATDFLEKPMDAASLLDRVGQALAEDGERRARDQEAARIGKAHRRLTKREREVMQLVVSGASSKEIARRLGLSHRTVDVHRAHLMEKMNASNVAELVNKVRLLTT